MTGVCSVEESSFISSGGEKMGLFLGVSFSTGLAIGTSIEDFIEILLTAGDTVFSWRVVILGVSIFGTTRLEASDLGVFSVW